MESEDYSTDSCEEGEKEVIWNEHNYPLPHEEQNDHSYAIANNTSSNHIQNKKSLFNETALSRDNIAICLKEGETSNQPLTVNSEKINANIVANEVVSIEITSDLDNNADKSAVNKDKINKPSQTSIPKDNRDELRDNINDEVQTEGDKSKNKSISNKCNDKSCDNTNDNGKTNDSPHTSSCVIETIHREVSREMLSVISSPPKSALSSSQSGPADPKTLSRQLTIKGNPPSTTEAACRRGATQFDISKARNFVQLTESHIFQIKQFLKDPDILHDKHYVSTLVRSEFPRVRNVSLTKQFERYKEWFRRAKIEGQSCLCYKGKIVIARERYTDVVTSAHTAVGEFRSEHSTHNSFQATLQLLESKYCIGARNFGPSKYSVFELIANCSECTYEEKKLPRNFLYSSHKEDVMTEFVQDNNDCDYSVDELSMVYDGKREDFQSDDKEARLYAELLWKIDEIGMDLRDAVQGRQSSVANLAKKTRKAKEFVSSLKRRHTICEGSTYEEFGQLQQEYVDSNKLAAYFYDIKLLAAEPSTQKVIHQSKLPKFSRQEKTESSPFDQPIDVSQFL